MKILKGRLQPGPPDDAARCCFWLQTDRPQPEKSQQHRTAVLLLFLFFLFFIFNPLPSLALQINTSRGRRDTDAESLGTGKQKARFAARVKRWGDEDKKKKKKQQQHTKPTVCFDFGPWLEYPTLISSKRVFFFFVLFQTGQRQLQRLRAHHWKHLSQLPESHFEFRISLHVASTSSDDNQRLFTRFLFPSLSSIPSYRKASVYTPHWDMYSSQTYQISGNGKICGSCQYWVVMSENTSRRELYLFIVKFFLHIITTFGI